MVLVGGQAVIFWAEYYRARVAELESAAPFTSKDTDFLGPAAAVEYCAGQLRGEALFPDANDITPNTGQVIFADGRGRKQSIDFLRFICGPDADLIVRTSLRAVVLRNGEPTNSVVRIIHPELLMESRLANSVVLHRRGAHGTKQLRASIFCCREYTRDQLRSGGPRAALSLNERVFRLCFKSRLGREAAGLEAPDPFDAVLADSAFPGAFLRHRYPQMREWLAARRARWERIRAARGGFYPPP
jgi:hypothetical protein